MMIPTLTDYYDAGYLPRPSSRFPSPFFPNCNLSVRRSVFDQVGLYGEEFRFAAEDADLCRRASVAGWEMFYADDAVCSHEARPGLWRLIRQWYSYGYYGGRFFQKASTHRCEVYFSTEARPRVHRYRRVLKLERVPFPIHLFISYFPVAHVWLAAVLVSLWAGPTVLPIVLGAGLLGYLLALYLGSSLRKLTVRELCIYLLVTYLINVTCVASSVAGGIRRRSLFLFPGV